ncbi:MAG TPA: NAD(P)-binding domain-containing protein, partial [Geminicoccaceae bacterium]|nr:NAD(P)-binding domain-containing protein [Geminicoccaceae bacterium]
MTMRIGVIGVGTIGGPLAANIVRGGHPVLVHDLRPEAVAAMTALGATAPGGIAALARASDVVITILPDAPDVEAAALGPGGIAEHIREGAVYLDMSTIDPGTSRRIGAVLAAKGVGMLDAPITRSVDHARAGKSALLVGGEPALLERVRPILACMADTITHCGP